MTSLQQVQPLPFADSGATAIDRGGYTNERQLNWMRSLGVARIGVLTLVAIGAAFIRTDEGATSLVLVYAAGFAVGVWYLFTLVRTGHVSKAQSWIQVLVDFGVVAVTVAYTDGASSYFTFMFVVVVLEAGLLLGLSQSLAMSTMASVFMLQQMLAGAAGTARLEDFGVWYNFIVQCLAFYLTALISGYWTQRLRLMQEFQRVILDNMNSGFLITDRDGYIAIQNRAASEILGNTIDPSTPRPVSEVLRVESGDECPVVTALRRGQDFTSYEFRVRTEEGESLLLGLTTNCLRNSRGEITGVIASFVDLAEMSAMREELRRQDRLAVVGELAAGLAHEIRNPVAVIRGALEELPAMRSDETLEEKLRSMAIRESDHLNEIVSGFLNFAREPSTKREQFDASELAREVGEVLQHEYQDESAVRIEVVTPRNVTAVSGDPSQVKQVLMNLGKNAVEAMQQSGTLRISVSNENGPVEIRFDDEGSGIEPEQIARIFEPFFTTKDSGVGMGLAVCLRIITAHDGRIMASARAEGGTTMKVELPGVAEKKGLAS